VYKHDGRCVEEIADEVSALKKQVEDLFSRLDALSEVSTKVEETIRIKPSEKILVVNSDEQKTQIVRQIAETINRIVGDTVREEFDKLRGKIK
jgi:ubiquinone biosynthesis protein UbiJ